MLTYYLIPFLSSPTSRLLPLAPKELLCPLQYQYIYIYIYTPTSPVWSTVNMPGPQEFQLWDSKRIAFFFFSHPGHLPSGIHLTVNLENANLILRAQQ